MSFQTWLGAGYLDISINYILPLLKAIKLNDRSQLKSEEMRKLYVCPDPL